MIIKKLLLPVLLLLTVINLSCNKETILLHNEDIIQCHNINNNVTGKYVIYSYDKNTNNDELFIGKDSFAVYYDYYYNGYTIEGCRLYITKKKDELYFSSTITILNGRVYTCDSILLLNDLRLKKK